MAVRCPSQELPAISGLYREEHSQPQNPVLVNSGRSRHSDMRDVNDVRVYMGLSGFGFGFLIWICPKLPDTSWNYMIHEITYEFT